MQLLKLQQKHSLQVSAYQMYLTCFQISRVRDRRLTLYCFDMCIYCQNGNMHVLNVVTCLPEPHRCIKVAYFPSFLKENSSFTWLNILQHGFSFFPHFSEKIAPLQKLFCPNRWLSKAFLVYVYLFLIIFLPKAYFLLYIDFCSCIMFCCYRICYIWREVCGEI